MKKYIILMYYEVESELEPDKLKNLIESDKLKLERPTIKVLEET
ncbi:MAG: hypothetical protein ACP5GU_09900 [Thermoprotei archaeon]|jgi:hypothetical protein